MTVRMREIHREPGFADDVRAGLTARPKRLPSKYLYDGVGSRLFEAICELAWYRITRAEKALLRKHAAAMLAGLASPLSIVELGPGSGEKLALLAEGLPPGSRAGVHLVDISKSALAAAERTLADDPRLSITSHAATYEEGLREAIAQCSASGSRLVLFLGSNIGNFDPEEAAAFLGAVRAALRPGDALLLGADLVKPEPELLLAYDDPVGVTAAFDKNLLARIDRELGGHFDLRTFAHEARWNPVDARVEMHLVSRRRQRVRIDALALDVGFEEGESIWTESSYKLTPERVAALGRDAGFTRATPWIDADAGFLTTRLSVAG
jgi:dimethylhistidine N-methyltransferase